MTQFSFEGKRISRCFDSHVEAEKWLAFLQIAREFDVMKELIS